MEILCSKVIPVYTISRMSCALKPYRPSSGLLPVKNSTMPSVASSRSRRSVFTSLRTPTCLASCRTSVAGK